MQNVRSNELADKDKPVTAVIRDGKKVYVTRYKN